jgi:putative transposase
MPEHVHLLVWPGSEDCKMAAILRLLKEPLARWVVKYWISTAPQLLDRIRVCRGARCVHRFWQEGGGYDSNLCKWESITKAIEYIEWNPVRRGFVVDPSAWQWSSARCHQGDKDVPLALDSIDVAAHCE